MFTMYQLNHLKMLTLLSLIIICQVNCAPVDHQIDSQVRSIETSNTAFDLSEDVHNSPNNQRPKVDKKRSSLDFYSSSQDSLPGQIKPSSDDQISDTLIDNYFKFGQNQCVVGEKTRDTCEKCAKLTRSESAFALCCTDTDNVRTWCEKFINYTYTTVLDSMN